MKRLLLGALAGLMLCGTPAYAEPPHQEAPDRPLANDREAFVFGKVERYFHWRYAHGNVDSYFIPRCGPVKCIASVAYNQGPDGDLLTLEACWVVGVHVRCRTRRGQEWPTYTVG